MSEVDKPEVNEPLYGAVGPSGAGDGARLPLITDDTTDLALRQAFQRARDGFGFVPNLYRTLGHSPELLEAWLAFAWPLRHAATTKRSIRELVILRVAQIDDSAYEWEQHRPMAVAAGVSEQQLDHLAKWTDHLELFEPPERAALAVAEGVADDGSVSDLDWQRLTAEFDERGCLEIVLTASFYACVSRVLTALRVPLEEP